LTQVRKPEATVLFGDGQWRLGGNKFMRSPAISPSELKGLGPGWNDPVNRSAGTQGFRHRNRSNVAFCDGHAESMEYGTFNRNRPELARETGFLSNDNALYDLD
jgi:prepilin-type processing-associated H-X9-DG protein